MTHILQLAQEPAVTQPNQQPKPDEKAQIVLIFPSQNPQIIRYKRVDKAEKDYKALQACMRDANTGRGSGIVELKGDMFVATVDTTKLAAASFVDIEKRMKFVPYPAG